MSEPKLSEALTVIVCGSRHGVPAGAPGSWALCALDDFAKGKRVDHVISGGAPGIDTDALAWARANYIPSTTFWADWHQHKRAAGPIRNWAMLEFLVRCTESTARAVLAFPGGAGTADMASKARERGVPVWRCSVVGVRGRRWDLE